MIKIIDKANCCGCTACAMVCPTGAIGMHKDNEGFAYPAVCVEKCIKCNLCDTVCPYIHGNKPETDIQKTYAAFNRNPQQREKSSSGGMFLLLATEILSRGGVVFGAGYDDEWCAVHKQAENTSELDELIGSKYMQSELRDTFHQIKAMLEADRLVMMVGTTCQIAGLKNYLRKEYQNLYCVDFICLGVPSSQVWKDYIETFFDKEKITRINFKDKSLGWHRFSLDVEYSDHKYKKEGKNTYFFRGYFDYLYTRPSCSNCLCKKGNRNSDITLSDCWGAEMIAPEMDDNKGMSSIVCHTPKGLSLFESVQTQLVWKEANFADVLKYNSGYEASVPVGERREAFWRDYRTMDKKKLFRKYCSPGKKSFAGRLLKRIKACFRKGQ